MRRVDSLEKALMLGGIGGRRRRDDRGWDGWMASLTRWTWVWINSGSWWWTGRPGVLWFMGSQRFGHDWATDLVSSDLMSVSISQSIPPSLPTWCSLICSLHLCLYFCFANKIIYTIFFYIPHICVNIWYLFFSFWLTSLYMTVSRLIHISTNDPVLFLFMAE